MRKFLLTSLFLLIVVGGFFFFILTRVDGYIDTHYLKVNSPRQSNLILGTSRAAVGVNPDILYDYLSSNYYNFYVIKIMVKSNTNLFKFVFLYTFFWKGAFYVDSYFYFITTYRYYYYRSFIHFCIFN